MEKQINMNLKNTLTGALVILLYLIAYSYPYELLKIIGINPNNLNIFFKTIYLLTYEISLTLIIVYIYKKDIIPNFKDFIKNNITYFKEYIKYWFLMLILTTSEIATNQKSIIETLKMAPIYTFIITVFVAPILEELIFRLSFRKIFYKSNILFIFFSGLIFGSMHVISTCENLIDLLFIIPYSIPGFIFAYVYTKCKNICVPISLHFIHNGIMMSLQILLLILS